MLENGKRIKSKDKAYTRGLMEGNTTASGTRATCMDTVSTPGRMVESMRDSTRTIRNMAKEHIDGLMGGFTKAVGRMGSSMEKASIFCQMENQSKENGKMALGRGGFQTLRHMIMMAFDWFI